MRKLACMVTSILDAVSHMRGTCRFKPFWPRNYMQSYLGLRMIEVHRMHVKYLVHVDGHVLCCYWLLVRCVLHLRCTGDRVQERGTCVI